MLLIKEKFILKKLFKAIAILTSFSFLTRALGFLFRIILSRLIGAEGLGIYQVSFSVFMVLETFISSGLPLVVSKKTSNIAHKNEKNKEFSMVTTAIIIGLITAILLCIIVLIFNKLFALLFTDKRCLNILITLLPSLVFSSVYATIRGNFWGHRKYFIVSFTEFIEQLLKIVFCVIFLGFSYQAIDGVFVATYSHIISCFVSAILVLILFFKMGNKFSKPTINEFKELTKASIPITLVRVISSLLMPLISIIIPLLLVANGHTSEQALSILGIALGMTFPLLYIPSTLIGSLSMTLIPDLSSAVTQQKFVEIKEKINFSIKFGLFISFLFVPLFYSLGPHIGVFLYNNLQSGIFLRNSSILIIPICLSGIAVSCLNALSLEIKGFINYLIGALFLIISIFTLTRFVGIYSLVIGLGLCLGIAFILNIILLNKKLNCNFFNFNYLIKLIISSVPCALISKWTFSIFTKFLPMLFSLGFSCVIGILFFLCSALLFGLFNFSFLKLQTNKKRIN